MRVVCVRVMALWQAEENMESKIGARFKCTALSLLTFAIWTPIVPYPLLAIPQPTRPPINATVWRHGLPQLVSFCLLFQRDQVSALLLACYHGIITPFIFILFPCVGEPITMTVLQYPVTCTTWYQKKKERKKYSYCIPYLSPNLVPLKTPQTVGFSICMLMM